MTNVTFQPASRLRGTVDVPADKSMSHRAALLAAMSDEPVRVYNYLDADDTNSTLNAIRALGTIVEVSADHVTVRGGGLRDLPQLDDPIDVGNAGTLMRLLPGWLAAQAGRSWTLDGDASIRRRPIDRVAAPLEEMGARIDASDGNLPPFTVHGARLRSIDYESPVASAQVKSCVLIAGLTAEGRTSVLEPSQSRDHTERMLCAAGIPVEREGTCVTVTCSDEMDLDEIHIPGDQSSAAFLVAAALIVPRSKIVLPDVGLNWTRTGFLRICERMGAVIDTELEPMDAPLGADEPRGEMIVVSGPLDGTVVEPGEVPLAIDELPLVALLGCFAEGETVVRGAQELRIKESDRISLVVEGLRGLGAEIEATRDGFVVQGTGGLDGGVIESHGDHRLAMLGAVAGLASRDGVTVVGMDAAAVSYPLFLEHIGTLA